MKTRLVAATVAGALTLLGVGVVLPPGMGLPVASAASAIYIDDPLQTSISAAWTRVAGANTTVDVVRAATGLGDNNRGQWLQLTSDQSHGGTGESGFVLNNTAFSSSRGVVVEYDQRIYRTNDGNANAGAGDGLSVFLVDANIAGSTTAKGSGTGANIDTTTDEAGGFGAGLGYTSVAGADESWCGAGQAQGVAGGYIGIGFDVFGNYAAADTNSDATTGRTRPRQVSEGGVYEGKRPNSVGLRGSGVRHAAGRCHDVTNEYDLNYWYGRNTSGSGSDGAMTHGGYTWLAGTGDLGSNSIDNAKNDASRYRRVKITLTPGASGKHQVRVYMSQKIDVATDTCLTPAGATGTTCTLWRSGTTPTYTQSFSYDLGNNPWQADLPETFKLGFAASTGWAVNNHQIRNLRVTTPTDISVTKKIALGTPTGNPSWEDTVTGQVGDTVSYQIAAHNNGPSDLDPDYPATLTEPLTQVPYAERDSVPWTAVATGGAALYHATSGSWVTELTGTGPLTQSSPLLWHSPSRTTTTTAAVTVTFSGTVATGTAAGTYPNTATVTSSTVGGPQESYFDNNADAAQLVIIDPNTWSIAKKSDPQSGAAVTAGRTITYSVTATADAVTERGSVRGVVLTDNLDEVLSRATFVSGSAKLKIGTGAAVTLPDPTPTGSQLVSPTFDLPRGTTAVLTYAVRVKDDVPGGISFRNVVTGTATSNAPETCRPPASFASPEAVCTTLHATPRWSIEKTVSDDDASDPTAVLPDDALVQPGDTLTYRVTASNTSALVPVRATLNDDLSDLLGGASPKATFDPGTVQLVVDGIPADITLPDGPDAQHHLVVGPFTLPPAQTVDGATVPTTAVLTYKVTIADDAWSTTLSNLVTGAGDDGDVTHPMPPETCTPDAPCTTTQRTPALVQVEKLGEANTGENVRMSGSGWALHTDDAGEPSVSPVVADIPAATDADGQPITGLFRTQLAAGTYWLVETRAPTGFQLLPTPVKLTVAVDGTVALVDPPTNVSVSNDTAYDHVWTVVVQDVPALDLPESGGERPTALLAAGILLTAFACALGVRARRTRTGRS